VINFFHVTFQCLAERNLCMSDQWSDGQEKYISMELRPTTIMGAFFSIQIRFRVKKFRLQAPWSQNWCLVPELVFDSYVTSHIIVPHQEVVFYPSQQLELIALVAGQPYYFEVRA